MWAARRAATLSSSSRGGVWARLAYGRHDAAPLDVVVRRALPRIVDSRRRGRVVVVRFNVFPRPAGTRRIALSLLAAAWTVSLLVGLVLLVVPESPKTPLVPRDGWVAEGAVIQNFRPAPGEVSNSIRDNSAALFARTWSPEAGSQPGRLVSPPFPKDRYIAVPFAGYPARPGNAIYLECVADATRLPIAYGNAHEVWVERTLRIPRHWCPSRIRL